MNEPAQRTPDSSPSVLRRLPGGIWALGLGSLFMDTSSELIHSLLPIYMASVLGASILTIGIVEGIAEATAAIAESGPFWPFSREREGKHRDFCRSTQKYDSTSRR